MFSSNGLHIFLSFVMFALGRLEWYVRLLWKISSLDSSIMNVMKAKSFLDLFW